MNAMRLTGDWCWVASVPRLTAATRGAAVTAMLGLALLLSPVSTARLRAQEPAPATKEAVGRPPFVRGRVLADWIKALKDFESPAERKRAVEVLGAVTENQAGDLWPAIQAAIDTAASDDKDAGVRQAAARIVDRRKVADPNIKKPLLDQESRAVGSTMTSLRLVDAEGRPVEGALVSTYFQRNRDRSPSFLPPPSLAKSTDARGEASLELMIPGRSEGTAVYAIREEPGQERPLVGIHVVTREEIGRPVTITMYPACRVRVRAECPGFRELEQKYNAELSGPRFWRAAYVFLGEPPFAPRPLFTDSTTGELEFLLPPGRYNLMIYGSDVTWATRPIEVAPGHRVRSLGVVELDPDDDIKQGRFRLFHHWTQPDPRADPNVRDAKARVAVRRVAAAGLLGDARGIQEIGFSPDGNLLATTHWHAADPAVVNLWNARTGEFVAELPVPGRPKSVSSPAFSPDGKLLAVAVRELDPAKRISGVALWDVSARRGLSTLDGPSDRTSSLAFSPDGLSLAVCGDDRIVRLRDLATGREARRLERQPGPVRSLAFTPDGKILVIWSENTVKLWDLEENRLRASIDPARFWTCSVALSRDGRTLAIAGAAGAAGNDPRRGQVRLYDLSRDPPNCRAELVFERDGTDQADDRGSPFWDVVFTADGRSVAAVKMTTVVFWDAASGTVRDYFGKDSGSSGDQLAISPDGRRLAVTDASGLRIVDMTPPPAPRPPR